jgi:hypothetical protein
MVMMIGIHCLLKAVGQLLGRTKVFLASRIPHLLLHISKHICLGQKKAVWQTISQMLSMSKHHNGLHAMQKHMQSRDEMHLKQLKYYQKQIEHCKEQVVELKSTSMPTKPTETKQISSTQ